MAKKIKLPARLVIVFGEEGNIETCEASYTAFLEEYPDFPSARLIKEITLTAKQKSSIKKFCKEVVLPQLVS